METAVGCAIFVLTAEPVTIALLRRVQALDVPNGRSSHTVATPRGGGMPIVLALALAVSLTVQMSAATFTLPVAALAALGLADDFGGLSPGLRLTAQAGIAVWSGAALAAVADLGPGPGIIMAIGLAVWLIGYVNAFNFMDGVNGISGAHTLIGGAFFAVLGWWRGDSLLLIAGMVLAAGALAFLPWNAVRARVFLGDVGSYGIGAALAVLAAWSVLHGISPEAALGPLALYLSDTGWTLVRRLRAGEPILRAHRTHVYQRLTDLGWSHQRVTAVTGALSAVLACLGAVSLFHGVPAARVTADLAGIAILAAYLASPVLLGRAIRLAEVA